MALRDEYYLRFYFIVVIRKAFFSIISMDQIFQVARQTCCCTVATQDPWDIPMLLPLGTRDPESPRHPDPAPREKLGLGAPDPCCRLARLLLQDTHPHRRGSKAGWVCLR